MRIQRTKSGRPLSVPLNATALATLQALHENREPVSPYVFPHRSSPNAGEPVMDIKNGFHAGLELAEIQDFTWHDLRHTFASWLMMRGASLRSVAELLGHASMKMTMRYAHLSPAFLSAEVSRLDRPPPASAPPPKGKKSKSARKGQRASNGDQRRSEVPVLSKEFGSPH
jgi:integrase